MTRPISPDNIGGGRVQVSPDGKWVLGASESDLTGRNTLMVPIDGTAPVPIAGLQPGDYPLGWTADDRIYIAPQLKASDTSISVAFWIRGRAKGLPGATYP